MTGGPGTGGPGTGGPGTGGPHVRRVVDLSHPLGPAAPVYPGDPPVRFTPHATVARDGYALLRVQTGTHSGTHVDAPAHVLADGVTIDAVDPGLFVGPGVVVDVRHRRPGAAITLDDLSPALARVRPGVIVLLWTGWSDRWGDPSYLQHPFLEPDACRALLATGVRTVGLDTPSIDPTGGDALPCHRLVAEAGGVIVENLTRLSDVGPDALVSVLPVRLDGADGAPVRAVAIDLER